LRKSAERRCGFQVFRKNLAVLHLEERTKNSALDNLSVPLGNAVTLLMDRRMASSLLLLLVALALLQPAR
jgi:hypothetical protein